MENITTKIGKWVLLALLPAFALGACSKEDTDAEPGGTPGAQGSEIRFEIGFGPEGGVQAWSEDGAKFSGGDVPKTRVATDKAFKSAWTAGDEIGIFAFKEGTLSTSKDYYIENMKLTFDGEKWTPAAPIYWPNDGSKLRFYACYPYNAMSDLETFAFSVHADQSSDTDGKSNLDLSDLLLAQTAFYDKTASIPLVFLRYTGMIQVTLDNLLGVIDPNEEVTVILRDVLRKANIDFKSYGWTAMPGSDKGAITMRRVEQPGDADYYTRFTFRAIVPQQMIYNKRIFRIANGSTLLEGSETSKDFGVSIGEAHLFTQKLPYTALKLIEAGKFLMGSPDSDPDAYDKEKPQREVTIDRDFYMGRFEVTRTQYAEFLNAVGVAAGANDITHTVEGYGEQVLFEMSEWGWTPKWNEAANRWEAEGEYPMMYVSWYGAKAYADWAGGRLPTSEEWEYACRAGTRARYSFGDDAAPIDDYAVYNNNSRGGPSRIGSKLPNPWGLYDMHGNVNEWCDGSIVRGGSWNEPLRLSRSACWMMFTEDLTSLTNGFRLVFDKK